MFSKEEVKKLILETKELLKEKSELNADELKELKVVKF